MRGEGPCPETSLEPKGLQEQSLQPHPVVPCWTPAPSPIQSSPEIVHGLPDRPRSVPGLAPRSGAREANKSWGFSGSSLAFGLLGFVRLGLWQEAAEGRADTAQAASRLAGIRAPILEAPVAAEQKRSRQAGPELSCGVRGLGSER